MKANPSSTHKKVVIHRLDKGLVKGYVDPLAYLGTKGVELLDTAGRLVRIPLEDIKGIYFVRDFEGNPQQPERKVFHSRPRLSGLWIRMTFKDNEVQEGLISKNLLDLDSLGFLVTPPDLYSNNLRIFIPRSALTKLEVLGVISNGVARRNDPQVVRARRKPADASQQIRLFPSSIPAKAE